MPNNLSIYMCNENFTVWFSHIWWSLSVVILRRLNFTMSKLSWKETSQNYGWRVENNIVFKKSPTLIPILNLHSSFILLQLFDLTCLQRLVIQWFIWKPPLLDKWTKFTTVSFMVLTVLFLFSIFCYYNFSFTKNSRSPPLDHF